jgi:Fe-S cluster biogenesis protein NfuA
VPETRSLRAVGDRIEAMLAELKTITDPRARRTAEELVRLLLELYGGGIERMMEIVDESPLGGDLFARFAADDLVASLMLLHGLHPEDAEVRIARALDKVRPFLASHGGGVTVLGIADGVIRLRLEGSCHGCQSSTVTMKLAIEKAIEEAAPELVGIEVEGVVDPAVPAVAAVGADGEGLVQIGLRCPGEIESAAHG